MRFTVPEKNRKGANKREKKKTNVQQQFGIVKAHHAC